MRQLLVTTDGDKEFKITIPDNAKVTFAPFSPPTTKGYGSQERAVGTLRIYQGSKDNIIGMFTRVASFRDTTSVQYAEKVAVEEGATMWKDDQNGYVREEKVSRKEQWIEEDIAILAPSPAKRRSR